MGLVVLLVLLFFINEIFYKRIAIRHPFVSIRLIRKIFLYHLLFAIVYYVYAVYNPSDSKHYYSTLSQSDINWVETIPMTNWGVFFVEYPFLKYLDFNYEMLMLLFSWFGFVGFVYAYLFFAENIKEKIIVFGKYDLLKLLLFLPNMHFWSASIGKGSMIFMGIMMFIYAVQFPKKRLIALALGSFFIFSIRSHVMFFIIIGVLFGIFFGSDKKLTKGTKVFLIFSGMLFIYLAWSSILSVANLEQSDDLVNDFNEFAYARSEGLSEKAGSGLDMSKYSLPVKLFTFWFRPLFIDVPSSMGIFSSLENLLYLLLFLKICNKSFVRFIKKAPSVVKMSAMIFVLTSFAMTFIMSNLGIIMRQKAQVMYFAFFVIYYFLAYEKARKRYLKQKQQDHIKEPLPFDKQETTVVA
ncbi:hypothetical protein HKT18_10070 [Flavobacterium sp. IMCC34852]|uniref:Uncharacterized protein n=1 Tax=Flavobacterium rivulicola TaxID=2732161 RepID=A0A7Y3RAX1_9FLAO|nr:hypothetical protein [Flavobacterium sp. IMCC34852]NNT72562.1 hypothetical protein [Flavobacterium sp. IMCC34852]